MVGLTFVSFCSLFRICLGSCLCSMFRICLSILFIFMFMFVLSQLSSRFMCYDVLV